ncbi:hypothetical protein CTU88_37470 [Streptomyces sp. JV178]|jgi:hypothetical protein|uniref:hypothetical protein n=1 Tax=Streptomyces sp. JV178 TaxID=858632 RepID=UPI000C1B2C48|nr:hypothetical protein [Streptomyces sp. JV178]PIM67648.1 hypothetical protein CTU88_37470 [Streptomyces sp. JV178]
MPTSIKVLLLVFGGVLLLAALLGSGFSIREISFPPMNPLLRTVTVLLGAGLMVTSVVLLATEGGTKNPVAEPSSGPTTTAPGPSPSTTPPPEPNPVPDPDAPPSDAPPTDEPGSDEAEALMRHIPKSIRSDCVPGTASYTEALTAYVDCRPDRVPSSASYFQFADAPSMDGWFQAVVDDHTFTGDSCDSYSDLNGQGSYSVDGTTTGKVVCFAGRDGRVHLMWTHEPLAVIVEAVADPADYDQLIRWWSVAGPNNSTEA